MLFKTIPNKPPLGLKISTCKFRRNIIRIIFIFYDFYQSLTFLKKLRTSFDFLTSYLKTQKPNKAIINKYFAQSVINKFTVKK